MLSVRTGLLFAAPLLTFGLVLLAGRPSARRLLLRERPGRGLPWLLGACTAYVVFIAALDNPEPTAWGPRYLLPVTPISTLLVDRLCPVRTQS